MKRKIITNISTGRVLMGEDGMVLEGIMLMILAIALVKGVRCEQRRVMKLSVTVCSHERPFIVKSKRSDSQKMIFSRLFENEKKIKSDVLKEIRESTASPSPFPLSFRCRKHGD